MGDSVRLVRGTAHGDTKSSCAPGFSGVRRSAAASDLVTAQNPVTYDILEMQPTAEQYSKIVDSRMSIVAILNIL